jgi:endogenous inhibitor of DNA gyrase (YacG/DUF329 family)
MMVTMLCPICEKQFAPHQSDALPFCSERCRTVDLGRWLGEKYSLPTVPDPDEDDADGVDQDAQSPAGHASEPFL